MVDRTNARRLPSPPSAVAIPSSDVRRFARNRGVVRRGFWAKVRATLGRIPFVEDAVAGYFCALDPATPLRVKAVLFAALAYFITPADAIPDIVPALGYTDDLAVLVATLRLVGAHLTDGHRAHARKVLADGIGDRPSA